MPSQDSSPPEFSDASPAKALRVTYDSSNARMQWRCLLYGMRNFRVVLFVGALAVAFAYFSTQLLFSFLLGVAGFYALYFIGLASAIKQRTSAPRICTTVIDETGVRDIIPEYDRTYPWEIIKRIEIVEGDIYFASAAGGLFIPASAFADERAALEFYKKANKFWQTGRRTVNRNQKGSPSSEEGTPAKMEGQLSTENLIADDKSAVKSQSQKHGAIQSQVENQGQEPHQVQGVEQGEIPGQVQGQSQDEVPGQVHGQTKAQVKGEIQDQAPGEKQDQVPGEIPSQIESQMKSPKQSPDQREGGKEIK